MWRTRASASASRPGPRAGRRGFDVRAANARVTVWSDPWTARPRLFFIYRGPYGASHHDGGKFICRWLREYYGGPSCGVTYVAGDTCGASITFRENATLALTALYATAQDEDRPRGKALKKLVASRPEWYLSPRPDEATPGSLEDFLKDVACGSHDDAVRRKSMRDGFIAGTPLVPYPLDRSN